MDPVTAESKKILIFISCNKEIKRIHFQNEYKYWWCQLSTNNYLLFMVESLRKRRRIKKILHIQISGLICIILLNTTITGTANPFSCPCYSRIYPQRQGHQSKSDLYNRCLLNRSKGMSTALQNRKLVTRIASGYKKEVGPDLG